MKKILILLFVLIFFEPVYSQTIEKLYFDSSYLKTGYFGSGPSSDGNIIWTGYAFDSVFQNSKRFIVKIYSDGNYLNGIYFDSVRVYNFCNTPDNGYLFTGIHGTYPNDISCIIKTDQALNVEWSKNISKNPCIGGTEYQETPFCIGGNYYLGSHHRFCNQINSAEIFKIDNQGNLLDQTAFGDTSIGYSFGSEYLISPDSELVVVGVTYIDQTPELFITLTKVDTNLNLLSCKKYRISGYDYLDIYAVEMMEDGSVLITGKFSLPFYQYTPNFFIMKISANGSVLFSKQISTNPVKAFYHYPFELADHSILFSGYIRDTITNQSLPFILKYDSSGNYLFSESYSFPAGTTTFYKRFYDYNDTSLVIFGQHNSSAGVYPFFIKTDETAGNICFPNSFSVTDTQITIIDSTIQIYKIPTAYTFTDTSYFFQEYGFSSKELCQWISVPEVSQPEINLFPNPSTGKFVIEFTATEIESIRIYNLLGEEIIKAKNDKLGNRKEIDISNAQTGIYIVEVSTGGKTMRRKIIKE